MKFGAFLRTLTGGLVAAAASAVMLIPPTIADTPPALTHHRHFIVLIRTNTEMKDKAQGRIRDLLIGGLYGNMAGQYRYNPDNDTMSVAYYSLSSVPNGNSTLCPSNRDPGGKISGKVLDAQHIFDWAVFGKHLSSSALAEVLNNDLNKDLRPCRYVEEKAPGTALVRTLALGDINSRLAPGDRFDQVIIVTLSMNAFTINPNDELGALRHADYQTDGVSDLITRVQTFFYFREGLELVQNNRPVGTSWEIIPPGKEQDKYNSWTASQERGANKEFPLFLLIAEVRPTITSPEPVVPDAIFAEPRAVDAGSAIKVKPVSAEPSGAIIRADSQSWQLLSGSWITEQNGQPTLFESNGAPIPTRQVDVLDCDNTACVKQSNGASLPLLAGVGLTEPVSPGKWAAPNGKAWFSAKFRYLATGIYDHLVHSSEPKLVNVGARPLPKVRGGIFPSSRVTASDVANQWQSPDAERGGLSADDAVSRIEGSRAIWTWIDILILIVTAGGAFAIWWYFLPGRGFKPQFSWRPAADPVLVDFNASGQQTVLLGTLVLTNTGTPGRVSAIALRTQAERRAMTIDLASDEFSAAGFVFDADHPSPALGFFRPSDEADKTTSSGTLLLQWGGDSAAAAELLVFLARDHIVDFAGDPQLGLATVACNIPLKAQWQEQNVRLNGLIDLLPRKLREKTLARWPRRPDQASSYTIGLNLTVKAKDAVPPVVEFNPAPGKAFYTRDPERPGSGDVALGFYRFRSPETLHFAQIFAAEFALAAQIEGRKVNERAVSLQQSSIALAPSEIFDNAVVVHCDCEDVVNPMPPSHRIDFQCLGPAQPGSDMTLKVVELFRDPTVSSLDIAVNSGDGDEAKDVYWSGDGALYWRSSNLSPAPENRAATDRITLDAKAVRFGRAQHMRHTIAVLSLRNPASNGKGRVSVKLTPRLKLADAYGEAFQNRTGGTIDPDTLVKVFDTNLNQIVNGPLVLSESDDRREIEIIFQSESVFDIKGGIIPAEKALASVDIETSIWTDEQILDGIKQEMITRRGTLETPLAIELLPPNVWLCIDFGTSAIAVARNDAEGGALNVLNLQTVKQKSPRWKDFCFAKFDRENPEWGTPFLPSSVVFDADLRQDVAQCDGEPGFPKFAPASLIPGDSSFVSLPASIRSDEKRGPRTVYSLKSWFSTGSNRIVLDSAIKVQDTAGSPLRETDEVAMKDAIASTFAALCDAYIRPQTAGGMEAGRIVLTHPNTLTPIHVEEFLNLACSVLQKRFRIPVKDRITAVSESDAVAYYYVGRLRDKQPPEVDTLLVYDFGAGTTDISIVRIDWNGELNPLPKRWTTLARLGVPIAGNYIDKLIAKIVDAILKDESLTDHKVWKYQYPIVANMLCEDDGGISPKNHVQAIREGFWSALREAKHGAAKGQERYEEPDFIIKLKVGEAMRNDQSILVYTGAAKLDEHDPAKPAARRDQDNPNETLISIPAAAVFESDTMTGFLHFVTKDLIAEAMKMAGLQNGDITSVVVSGRGALWPGLRQAVWAQFPAAAKPDLLKIKPGDEKGAGTEDLSSDQMKYAVVEGAIEFQRVSKGSTFRHEDAVPRPKLAVVLERGRGSRVVIGEADWNGKWLNVAGTYVGRIYQHAHDNPEASDFDGYRKHFYTVVPSSSELFQDSFAFDGQVLLTRKDLPNGGYVIEAKNRAGNIVRLGNQVDMLDAKATLPDWPIGSVLISPNDK